MGRWSTGKEPETPVEGVFYFRRIARRIVGFMAEPKFGAVTSTTATQHKNYALYAKQRQALEKSAFAAKLLRSAWPEETPVVPVRHGATPLQKDGVKGFLVDMPTLVLARENLLAFVDFVRSDPQFKYNFLIDLTCIDFLNSPRANEKELNVGKRFQMVYLLRSLEPDRRAAMLRICVPIDESEEVPSLTSVWPGADWPEREVFDLMGIRFAGHPNLRRIVLPDNYRGHPLRKDFPVKGIGEDYLIEDLLYKRRNVD